MSCAPPQFGAIKFLSGSFICNMEPSWNLTIDLPFGGSFVKADEWAERCSVERKKRQKQIRDKILCDKKERRKWRLDRFTKGQQFSSLCLGILISWKHNDAASSLYICCLEWFLFCITKLCLLMCWLCTSAFIAGSYYPNWMLLFSQALHNLIKIMSSVASKL